tara:strand:- start:2217 stop:3068 length:852 start_codon:yes stop_codon:yes gene_type:complete
MLDRDLAELYQVETKQLNRAVKRNISRFPKNFMFQLTKEEVEILKYQFGTSRLEHGGRRKLPFAFSEQGVAMLAGVLRSKIAIQVSVKIINSFIQMRKFIQSNTELFQRLDSVERKQITFDENFEKVFKHIEDKSITPSKGIFFDGQVFDAYVFVSKLIQSAQKSIVLIDNYVDDSVLVMLSKRKKGVSCDIYTENIKDKLKLDLKKHNSQYPSINLHKFNKSHDRFLIIDNKEVYHIGASLKDLGKKWFIATRLQCLKIFDFYCAFSKFEKETLSVLCELGG